MKLWTMQGITKSKLPAVLVGSLVLLAAPLANADVVFTVNEVGSDVVVVGEGSYDTTAVSYCAGCAQQAAFLNPTNGLAVGPVYMVVDLIRFPGIYPPGFGTGSFVGSTAATGDTFGFDTVSPNRIGGKGFATMPAGYISGTLLSGTATFAGSFASLGITPGIYKYEMPNNTLTVVIGDLDQIVPCAGNWANHGEYVSAYTHAVGEFIAAGLVTNKGKGLLVRTAAQSDCGK